MNILLTEIENKDALYKSILKKIFEKLNQFEIASKIDKLPDKYSYKDTIIKLFNKSEENIIDTIMKTKIPNTYGAKKVICAVINEYDVDNIRIARWFLKALPVSLQTSIMMLELQKSRSFSNTMELINILEELKIEDHVPMRSGQLVQIHNRNGNGIALVRRNTSQNTYGRNQQNQDSTNSNNDQQQVDSKKRKNVSDVDQQSTS